VVDKLGRSKQWEALAKERDCVWRAAAEGSWEAEGTRELPCPALGWPRAPAGSQLAQGAVCCSAAAGMDFPEGCTRRDLFPAIGRVCDEDSFYKMITKSASGGSAAVCAVRRRSMGKCPQAKPASCKQKRGIKVKLVSKIS